MNKSIVCKDSLLMTWARPKSAILRDEIPYSFDCNNRFSGLISLCNIPWLWQYLIASIIAFVASRASNSENYSFSRIWSKSSPPCINSITRHQCLSSSKTSMSLTILGWSTCLRISISVYMAALSSSLIFFFDKTLTANRSPVARNFAFLTVAKLPLPMVPSIL